MRIILMLIGAMVLNVVVVSGQTPSSKPKEQEQKPADILYDNVQIKRSVSSPRPKITMQDALKVAEDYINEKQIAIEPYYLYRVNLIHANAQEGVSEPYWWFWWIKEDGAFGDYVELGVYMDGRVRRIPSM